MSSPLKFQKQMKITFNTQVKTALEPPWLLASFFSGAQNIDVWQAIRVHIIETNCSKPP